MVKAGTTDFSYTIDWWYTTDPDAASLQINSYWGLWNLFRASDQLWFPAHILIWSGETQIGSAHRSNTTFGVTLTINPRPGRQLAIYQDSTGSTTFDPSVWQVVQPHMGPIGQSPFVYTQPFYTTGSLDGTAIYLAHLGTPVASLQFKDALGNVLIDSVPVNGTANLLLPFDSQIVLGVRDTIGEFLNAANTVAWEILDAVGNVLRAGNTLNVDFDGLPVAQIAQVTIKKDNAPKKTTNVSAIRLVITKPSANTNNLFLNQADYNSTGPITFHARVEGASYSGDIQWNVTVEYKTDGSSPLSQSYQFTSANDADVTQSFVGVGGKVTINAAATINDKTIAAKTTNYITGNSVSNDAITTRLHSLYEPAPGGTPGLLTGIAQKESTYRQFFNSYTKYDVTARWPIENQSTTPPKGTYIGMMQVPVAMGTAWDWLVNTQTASGVYADKLATATNLMQSLQSTRPGLPNFNAIQLENYALGLYGGYSARYYTPVQNGGQWQWQTTTTQSLLDYVSLIRGYVQ